MPTVLITGANRGIGLEFARQYAAGGWSVIATCRDANDAGELTSLSGDVEIHGLDVANHGQIQALAMTLKRHAIDLLLNNAGVHGPRPAPFGGVDYDAWAEVNRINVMGPLRLSECFIDHVARSDEKRIVTITSRMGSITENDAGGSYIYRSSKAAVNAVMRNLAVDLRPRGITVLVIHPGWVRTDMGGPSALMGVSDSVDAMRRVIGEVTRADSGSFLNYNGDKIPW